MHVYGESEFQSPEHTRVTHVMNSEICSRMVCPDFKFEIVQKDEFQFLP